MYDYMKALQKRFDRQSHPELDKQVEYAQVELRRDMDAAGRKKLLRLRRNTCGRPQTAETPTHNIYWES